MKDTQNLHLKVQEMCDCYATNDPLKEMSTVKNDPDHGESALKWLALAALHGVNHNAKEISISRTGDGHVSVTAKYREAELPSPGEAVGSKIFEAVGNITHMQDGKGKSPLALGIRNDSIELRVKMKQKEGGQKISIKFPD
jgi:hypothetical protein